MARMTRFDEFWNRVIAPPSYEEWSYLRWAMVITLSSIIFLLSPRWMIQVAKRTYGMVKAQLEHGDMGKYFEEQAERERELMRRGEWE